MVVVADIGGFNVWNGIINNKNAVNLEFNTNIFEVNLEEVLVILQVSNNCMHS